MSADDERQRLRRELLESERELKVARAQHRAAARHVEQLDRVLAHAEAESVTLALEELYPQATTPHSHVVLDTALRLHVFRREARSEREQSVTLDAFPTVEREHRTGITQERS